MSETQIDLLDHQARAHFARNRIVILLGGVGSGKSATDALWLLDRGDDPGEVAQLHFLAANSVTQLENGVLPEVFKWLEKAGIEFEYNHQPPASWVREWRELGIVVPPRPASHRRILTLRNGLHVLCATVYNRTYEQYRSLQFGSARLEEISSGPTLLAAEYIAERVRCGRRDICAKSHRHQFYLVGNPPESPDHWLFSYLDRLETAAERALGISDSRREPGTYPLLTRGEGPAILIQSATWDNAENLAENYAETLADTYDKETARRRLGGELIRVSSGRAAESFSPKNVYPVRFDPNRTVYVCLDFDMEPAVASFGHPLERGEYPDEWYREGRDVVGIFGEYMNTQGISVRRLAEAIVKGERGYGATYRDEVLRGLPREWTGLRGLNVPFVCFGDATGNQRSKTSDNLESSWQIVSEVFRQVGPFTKRVAEFNPSPRRRFHAFNARCESSTGIRSLFVDPRCEQLLADCDQVVWGEDGVTLKKWSKRAGGILYCRGHLLDSVSYMAAQLFPLGNDPDRASGSKQLEQMNSIFARRFTGPSMH